MELALSVVSLQVIRSIGVSKQKCTRPNIGVLLNRCTAVLDLFTVPRSRLNMAEFLDLETRTPAILHLRSANLFGFLHF